MRKINKSELYPENPFWADVLKFDLALSDSNIGKMITVDYVREKLQLILLQRATWHRLVENAYQETINRAQE